MSEQSFNYRRQGDQLLNRDLYNHYLALKYLLNSRDTSPNSTDEVPEGALYLDKDSGTIKFYFKKKWNDLYNGSLLTANNIMNKQIDGLSAGQLYIDENGVLNYYDGSQWSVVKSVSTEQTYIPTMFDQFLLLNNMQAADDLVVNGGVSYEQFLLPDVAKDRFFVGGNLITDATVISGGMGLQYPQTTINNKPVSTVHVNPNRLIDIIKKAIVVDKTKNITGQSINILEPNTEFYGFKTITSGLIKHGGGTLLVKGIDYSSVNSSILLNPTAVTAYDLILAVTYVYSSTQSEGSLDKLNAISIAQKNSLYIGNVDSTKLCVFGQGLCLDNDAYSYANGFVNFDTAYPLPEKIDITAITFAIRNNGTVAGNGTFTTTDTFVKPLVFVGSVETDLALTDFTRNGNIYTVSGALSGMSYTVIETNHIFVSSGTVTNTNGSITIPYDASAFDVDHMPILFVNGVLISPRDIRQNMSNETTGYLTVHGLTNNQTYSLLKTDLVYSTIIPFDDVLYSTTLAGDKNKNISSAMVYLKNTANPDKKLICDVAATNVFVLPATGINGELKLYNSTWHKYNEDSKTWVQYNTDTDAVLIEKLNIITQGHNTGAKTVNLLTDFAVGTVCDVMTFMCAKSVEEPLMVYEFNGTNGIITDTGCKFNTLVTQLYIPGNNTLSVWTDGIRQYETQEINSSTFELKDFKMDDIDEMNIFYVIESLESGESNACERDILNRSNRIPGVPNAYQTNMPLFPGNIKVFVNGYRQSNSAYRIIDTNMILFNDVIDNDSYETETKILIEVRQDYKLREITVPVQYAGQSVWTAQYDKIPDVLFDSTDFIMIYINGIAYGENYIVDTERKIIKLNNADITNKLGVDPLNVYFQKNPNIYQKYREKNGEYQAKPISDTVTFEWR